MIDCANGAGYQVAPDVLWELGAEVIKIGVEPNGRNINEACGTTDPEALCAKVREVRADIGIALDGDADRVVLVDEKARIVDGDQIMALIAWSWHQRKTLCAGGVVATVMSNLGLERYLKGLGLGLVRTPVGDRYVVEHMRRHGYNVGGEQSGHIVLSDFTTTGDGLVAALQVLSVVVGTGKPVSEVCKRFEAVPQLLENVRYANGAPLEHDKVRSAIDLSQGASGRGRAAGGSPLRHRAADPCDGRGRRRAHRAPGRVRHRRSRAEGVRPSGSDTMTPPPVIPEADPGEGWGSLSGTSSNESSLPDPLGLTPWHQRRLRNGVRPGGSGNRQYAVGVPYAPSAHCLLPTAAL